MENTPHFVESAGSKAKKRSLWFHLHFWIGWIAAVPIALVCLTGAILVFEEAIFQWEHPEFFHLEATGAPMSIGEVLDTYSSADPPLRVNHLGVPRSPEHAYGAYCTELHPDGNRGARVFLNPYTGELTRMTDGFSFSHFVVDVHRHLAAGRIGQQVVGVSSVILAVTGIIGLILWWPLRGRTFIRAWKRGQALDWHNALGLVALVPLIIMAITGITFTWGKHAWPLLENLQGQPSEAPRPTVEVPENPERVPFDSVVATALARQPEQTLTGIQPAHWEKAAHAFFFDGAGADGRLFINPYTGEEIVQTGEGGGGPVGWYRSIFGSLHTFGPYGLVLRILWGLLSLAGTVLVLTGLWVSIKRWRRPRRRTA